MEVLALLGIDAIEDSILQHLTENLTDIVVRPLPDSAHLLSAKETLTLGFAGATFQPTSTPRVTGLVTTQVCTIRYDLILQLGRYNGDRGVKATVDKLLSLLAAFKIPDPFGPLYLESARFIDLDAESNWQYNVGVAAQGIISVKTNRR